MTRLVFKYILYRIASNSFEWIEVLVFCPFMAFFLWWDDKARMMLWDMNVLLVGVDLVSSKGMTGVYGWGWCPVGYKCLITTMQVIDKEKISIIKDVQILGAYMWKLNPRYIASPSLICEELSPRLEPVVRRISPANLTTLPWTWNRQSRNVSLQSLSDFLDLPVPNTRSWNHLDEFNCHFWHRPNPCVKRILGLLNYST